MSWVYYEGVDAKVVTLNNVINVTKAVLIQVAGSAAPDLVTLSNGQLYSNARCHASKLFRS